MMKCVPVTALSRIELPNHSGPLDGASGPLRFFRSADFPVRSSAGASHGFGKFRDSLTFSHCCGLESPRSVEPLPSCLEAALPTKVPGVSNVLASALAPLDRLITSSDDFPLQSFDSVFPEATQRPLPAYVFFGPRGGGDPVRIGLFAGIHGDEPAGVHALVRFAEFVAAHPRLATGYHLFFYPVCNPSGFTAGRRCAKSGKDLNREFWSNSEEPEVHFLEQEIRSRNFHGLISLHADDTSDGLYGFVRGAVLSKGLLEPALRSAEKILPRNLDQIIDGFPAENGIISRCYEGILTSPPELDPLPFEIILETPHSAPQDQQQAALLAALQTILAEYQKLLSFAADL